MRRGIYRSVASLGQWTRRHGRHAVWCGREPTVVGCVVVMLGSAEPPHPTIMSTPNMLRRGVERRHPCAAMLLQVVEMRSVLIGAMSGRRHGRFGRRHARRAVRGAPD